jgi:hypothetical protein
VRAIDAQQQNLATYTTSVTTATLPTAPTKPVTAITSGTSVQLTWAAGPDSGLPNLDYKIEFSSNGGVSWSLFNDGVDANLVKSVTGLTQGTTYVFRVFALSSEGAGEKSQISTPAIPATAPDAPNAPTITRQSSNSIVISWSAPNDGGQPISNYVIQRSTGYGGWELPSLLPRTGTSTTATVTGLVNGVEYRFIVAAINAQGYSAFSNQSIKAMAGNPPGSVSNLRQTSSTNSSVSLAWNIANTSVGSILSYETQYSIDGFTWVTCTDGCVGTTATVSSLEPAQGYFFRVRAKGSTGWGDYTQIQAATKGVTSQRISILTSTGVPVTGGTISWELLDGSTESTLVRSLDKLGNVTFDLVTAGSASVKISQGLLPSGAKVSGTWTTFLGMSNLELRLPAEPVITQRRVTVQLPNGVPIPGATVAAQYGIASSKLVSPFTFSAPGTLSPLTNSLGTATLLGYATGSLSIQATYNDTVLLQRKNATLTSESTTITLDAMPWVSAPTVNKTLDYGIADTVEFKANPVQGYSRSGVLVKVERPAGSPAAPSSCKELLSARTNSSGIATLRICPTISGEYKVVTSGAVAPKPLRYTVNAPQLKLGASVSAYTLANQSKIVVPARATVSLLVSNSSNKNCKILGGKLVALKRGDCSVSITVQPATPRGAKIKPKALKYSKIIIIK